MAPRRALPFILPASMNEGARRRQLRRYRIKPANIARTYEADGWVLYIPTKKSFFKLPKEMVPGRELEHRIRRISDYIEEYKALIEVERRAEMEAQRREIATISGREREFFGRAVLGLKGRSAGRHFDLWLYRFGRDKAIETEIGSGDIVLISRGEPLKSDLTGTVMAVGRNYIEVALAQKAPPWVRQEGVRLDLYVNDVTFKRMESNLEAMRHIPAPYDRLRDILLGLRKPAAPRPAGFEPRDGSLNAPQKEAVAEALGMGELFLIHGPPGTGKTTTLVETVVQWARRGKRILAAADSNVAVDNMLAKLAEVEGLEVVRVGHPARIDEKLMRHSLTAKIAEDPRTRQVAAMLDEAQALVEARNRHSKPTPARLRGMSAERVRKLAAEGRSYRGVDIKTIQSMAMWLKEDEKVQRFYDHIRELERSVVRDILGKADVVLSTNGMVGSEAMEGLYFDIAAVDEASQQMEPSTLLPLMRAPRALMAGDHKQLPPTVVSGLDVLTHPLFERLMNENAPSRMLRVQYRMHETIMDFPNRLMYGGALVAHESVARRLLALSRRPEDPEVAAVLDPERPVVFADTSGCDAAERLPERSTSYENPFEAHKVAGWIEAALECGVAPEAVGVITPYLSQVKAIRRLLEARGMEGVEVKSVDGFQGREKELIFISFVRSNLAREIGFVKDARRLNVAMTRARRKLVMVGDRTTLEANAPFDRFFGWLEEERKARLVALSS
ncbi:IGHMBP2 family helicase [Hydrogenimonas sp.]